jgi:HD-GYP domain-containing protein (c-di-GMP phosphodiesterase class II)
MAKVTTLADFFPIQLGVLKENLPLTFSLYVYLSLNQRLVQLRRPDELLEEGFLQLYGGRGIAQLYVKNEEKNAYVEYIRKEKEKENEEKAAEAIKELEAKTQMFEEMQKKEKKEQDPGELPIEGAFTKDPEAPELPPEIELKEEQVAEIKEAVQAMMSGNAEERAEAMADAAALAQAVATEGESKQSLFTDLWQSSAEEKFDGHAKNISTFAVVFAMGMGYNNRDVVKSLSLAGLVHDLGVCQIDIETVRTPQELRSKEQKVLFEDHMRATIEMLAGLRLGLPLEVLKILAMHHEKFDGTGYPKKLKNWDVDAMAQILSMADVFDGMIRGRYDGKERTLTEAFKDVVTLEKSKIFPQYYNPDLFNKLVKWVETQSDTNILTEADKIVAETLDHNLKKPAA